MISSIPLPRATYILNLGDDRSDDRIATTHAILHHLSITLHI